METVQHLVQRKARNEIYSVTPETVVYRDLQLLS